MHDAYFNSFKTGTLFLIRTPDVFPPDYADRCFADMKRLGLDYAAWLETWNCMDGIIWKSNLYPRSSFWSYEERDPLEETFEAADRHGMTFIPEAGVAHDQFVFAHPDDMVHNYDGTVAGRFSRIGLVPSSPLTVEFFTAKYDELLAKFRHHRSFRAICMPCENSVGLSYDRHTLAAWRHAFSCPMPPPDEIAADRTLEKQVFHFLEDCFLEMYRKLARHLKQKHNLPLMHYPPSKISAVSHAQPTFIFQARNLTIMNKVKELDLLNLQVHPPLSGNIYHFKLEVEILQALCGDLPNVADTHFYHEACCGKLPDATPKRYIDYVLSTLTPFGISFFCYGFFAPQLPAWKKELNPGAKVFNGYAAPDIVQRRRNSTVQALDYVKILRPHLENTRHWADCAIYYREDFDMDYLYGSYYREHMFGLYELFQAAALPVRITVEIPESAAKQKVIVFDAVKSFDTDEQQRLSLYLASGGKAIILGNCCSELLGTCRLQVKPASGRFVRREDSMHYNHWCFAPPVDSLKFTESSGDALYFYDDAIPAVTRLENVVYFGCAGAVDNFCNVRSFELIGVWRKLFEQIDGDSGVKIRAKHLGNPAGHTFISADLYYAPDDSRRLLLLRNFGVEVKSTELNWNLPARFRISEAIIDGKRFSFHASQPLPEFEHFILLVAAADSREGSVSSEREGKN